MQAQYSDCGKIGTTVTTVSQTRIINRHRELAEEHFQTIRSVARFLCNSWASCAIRQHSNSYRKCIALHYVTDWIYGTPNAKMSYGENIVH